MTQGNLMGFSSWRYLYLYREQLVEQDPTLRVMWVILVASGPGVEEGEGGSKGKEL